MRFAYPWLLLLVPFFAGGAFALYRHGKKRAAQKLAKFSPASRLENVLRSVDFRAKTRKTIIFSTALGLLALTIARPLWGPRPDETEQSGAEFFIVLDVSKSMLVRDVPPNRLEAIKSSLAKWLKTRRGDRIGLILMAGDAFVQAPLTNDYTALREALEQSSPASMSLGGTNIPAAVKVATKAMEAGGVKHKTVLIVSDGENLEGQVTEAIAEAHIAHKITFFTLGVGTLEGGKVPEKDSKPDFTKPPKAYVKDDYGVTAHSRLDERTLRSIATAGGGRYFSFTPEGDIWDTLYAQALAPLARRTDTFKLEQYDDLFQIPLFLAIALLILEMSISTRNKRPARPRSMVTLPEPAAEPTAAHMPPVKARPVRSRVPAAALLLLASCAAAHAVSPTLQIIEQSAALLKAGKPVEAATALRAAAQTHPDDYHLVYNLGIASYAAGQYQEAIDSFSEASMSPDKKIRAQALMQIGNAQFQLGRALLKSVNRVGASVALERSVESYESALAVKSSSVTENNLKLSKERLELVLMNLGDYWADLGKKAAQPSSRIVELERAVGAFERVTQLNSKNTDAKQKLEQTRKLLSEQLRDQARELRAKAEQLADPKKEKEQEKLNVAANESYQKARDNAPTDKPLAQEHDEFRKQASNALTDKAEQKMEQAMQPPEKQDMGAQKRKESALNDTLGKVEKALAFDEKNARAQALKAKALKNLEEAHVAAGDTAKAAGDEKAATKPEGAAANFSEAMQDFQKALAINPENAHAKEELAKTEAALAKALTEAGKKELAQAAGQTPPEKPKGAGEKKPAAPKPAEGKPAGSPEGEPKAPKPGEGAGEKSAPELRENIGHLEKAAQSFAQAEALKPGENEAQSLQQQALEKLDAARAALDLAQNKPPGAPGAPGQPAPGGEPAPGGKPEPGGEPGASDKPPAPGEPKEGDKPAQKAMGQTPSKAVLTFSEIRDADQGEGLFKDLRQKRKIRDW